MFHHRGGSSAGRGTSSAPPPTNLSSTLAPTLALFHERKTITLSAATFRNRRWVQSSCKFWVRPAYEDRRRVMSATTLRQKAREWVERRIGESRKWRSNPTTNHWLDFSRSSLLHYKVRVEARRRQKPGGQGKTGIKRSLALTRGSLPESSPSANRHDGRF